MSLLPAANDYAPINAFGLPVRWDASGERLLPPKETTWPAVRQLLLESATACRRRGYLDEQLHEIERPLARLVFETAIKAGKKHVVRVITEQSHLRGDHLNDALHRALHAYLRGTMIRAIRQRDFTGKDGKPQSEILVYWTQQSLPVSRQLKDLDAALSSRGPLGIEVAWFGLTERAHEYLSVGFRIAHRLRRFQDFSGEPEVTAQVIPVLMPSPEVLRVLIPFALRAAARRGRRPVHDRDEALGAVLSIFAHITGTEDPGAWRAWHDKPLGPGAEFLWRIEQIFDVRLMPSGSTLALRRAYARRPNGGR